MPRDKHIALQFPMAGLDRRNSFQQQGPYTTPYCLNVRPDSSLAQRQRGGSRPGIGPAFREQLGSGNPIRMMAPIDVVQHNGYAFWQDTFEGSSLASLWTEASWLTESPSVSGRLARATYGASPAGVVRSAFSPVMAVGSAADYVVELWIVPYNGRHWGTYTIFLRMSDATPNATTGGIQARLTMTGTTGAFSGSLLVDGTTTYNFTSGTDGYAAAGWFTIRVSNNAVSAYWRHSTLISGQACAAATGQRVGFGMNATVSGGICQADRFRVQYYRTGQTQNVSRTLLMASSNGTLYRENEFGSMSAVSSSLTLASGTTLRAAQRTQKLYIADYSDWKISGTATGIGGGTSFDDSGVSDWTAHGIDTDDDVISIYDSSDPYTFLEGVYTISAVASGALTLGSSAGSSGTCSYIVTRGPKVYDHATDTLSLWTATVGKGAVPIGCPLICLYRDRLVLAGGADGPHIWYMSRQGDPLDWDYTAEDVGRAVAGSDNQAGIIGEPITALIPHADQCIVFGCRSSLWIMRGDPAQGGQISPMSHRVGIIDKGAWCYTPSQDGGDGLIVFLSSDGLYMIPAGCSASAPVSLSREKLPDELLDIDPALYEVSLVYDQRGRGVHVYVSGRDSQRTTHWWFDWETKGFFPVSVPVTMDPMCAMEYSSECSEDSAAILGCRDGYIRRYHRYHNQDHGANEIESVVDYGPILMGRLLGDQQGVLAELNGELGGDSAPIDFTVRSGNTAEAAYGASAQYNATWNDAGLNYSHNPRVGGAAAFLRMSNSTTRPWSLEAIRVRLQPMGKNRR